MKTGLTYPFAGHGFHTLALPLGFLPESGRRHGKGVQMEGIRNTPLTRAQFDTGSSRIGTIAPRYTLIRPSEKSGLILENVQHVMGITRRV
jgi:hypothetical protein